MALLLWQYNKALCHVLHMLQFVQITLHSRKLKKGKLAFLLNMENYAMRNNLDCIWLISHEKKVAERR